MIGGKGGPRTKSADGYAMSTRNTKSLYWFGPPERKTLRPVLGDVVLLIAKARRTWSSEGRPRPSYIARWTRVTRSVDPESRSVTTWKAISTDYKQYPVISGLIGAVSGILT